MVVLFSPKKEFSLSSSWRRFRTVKSWKETNFVFCVLIQGWLVFQNKSTVRKIWELTWISITVDTRHKKRVPATTEYEWLLLIFSDPHPIFFLKDWFENKWSTDGLPRFFQCSEVFQMWHYVDLAWSDFLVAGGGHRGSFCKKILEAPTMSNRANRWWLWRQACYWPN